MGEWTYFHGNELQNLHSSTWYLLNERWKGHTAHSETNEIKFLEKTSKNRNNFGEPCTYRM